MLPQFQFNTYQRGTLAILAGVALVAILSLYWPADADSSVVREVVIPQGAGAYAIASILKDEGMIRSTTLFIIYALALGEESNLKAGRYILSPSMTTPDIVWKVAGGFAEPDDIEVTIPEGENVWEIDQRLARAGLITEGDFAREFYGEEGLFFPDTYRFHEGTSVADIGRTMERNFLAKAGYVDTTTLVLASLLEKEARRKEDMGLVAGVIKNRLSREMLLQIDATVAYGACLRRYLTGNLSKNCDVTQMPIATELGIDGEFNTYRRFGLPSKPISNPGLQALSAARNPIASDYFFYLSTRDGSEMIFSKTGAEHARNRAKYLGL